MRLWICTIIIEKVIKMKDKFKNLQEEYFDTDVMWEYEWHYENNKYSLVLDEINGATIYKYIDINSNVLYFKDIYEAINNIKYNNLTLYQLLVDTDFEFDAIL